MRLTLSSNPNISSLQTFEHDVNVSAVVKAEVFKFLAVILKNLLKSDDAKYRQLRLGSSNPKIQRLTAHSAVMSFLQHVVGFDLVTEHQEEQQPGEQQQQSQQFLRIVSRLPSAAALQSALEQVTAAQERVDSSIPKTVSNSSSATSLPDIVMTTEPSLLLLTEKQKARKLAEQHAVREKEATKHARKRTVAQIQADKHVRENDPNWKPSVSAAAAKSGDAAILTFRDKFGENDN